MGGGRWAVGESHAPLYDYGLWLNLRACFNQLMHAKPVEETVESDRLEPNQMSMLKLPYTQRSKFLWKTCMNGMLTTDANLAASNFPLFR